MAFGGARVCGSNSFLESSDFEKRSKALSSWSVSEDGAKIEIKTPQAGRDAGLGRS